MDIRELEAVMVKYGLVIKAVPEKVTGVYEKEHADMFPDGETKYLDEYKRDMLVVESVPEHAGKFLFSQVKNTDSTVRFKGEKFYDSIEHGIHDIMGRTLSSDSKVVQYMEGKL